MKKMVVSGQLTIMSVAQHYLDSVCKCLGVQKTNTAHPHKEKQQMSHLEPCQFVLKFLWFSTPTGEHSTHTKEGTTKGEREMTEVACSGQHGK